MPKTFTPMMGWQACRFVYEGNDPEDGDYYRCRTHDCLTLGHEVSCEKAAHKGATGVLCPWCKREAVGWPLQRADVCSPSGWAFCLREPEAIMAKEVTPSD